MHAKPFLDTNIFLYAFSANEPDKQKIAKELILLNAVISIQVINETSVNLIKKFKLSEEDVQGFIKSSYARYQLSSIDREVFLEASMLRKKYHFSYYDSIIVASALGAGCDILYSEDMQHNLIVNNSLKIINPFFTKGV